MGRKKITYPCYVIRLKSDDWNPPVSFGEPHSKSEDGLYDIVRTFNEKDCTYETNHIFPSEIMAFCQNPLNANQREIQTLVKSDFWRGVLVEPGAS